jgi:hypothetical protein
VLSPFLTLYFHYWEILLFTHFFTSSWLSSVCSPFQFHILFHFLHPTSLLFIFHFPPLYLVRPNVLSTIKNSTETLQKCQAMECVWQLLGKWPTWRTNFFLCIYFYLQLSTCFEHLVFVIRRDKSYQYNLRELSPCVGGRVVCSLGVNSQLRTYPKLNENGHLHVQWGNSCLNRTYQFVTAQSLDLPEYRRCCRPRLLSHKPHRARPSLSTSNYAIRWCTAHTHPHTTPPSQNRKYAVYNIDLNTTIRLACWNVARCLSLRGDRTLCHFYPVT